MKLEHVAIWVDDLEKMKAFYTHYFGGKANDIYRNASNGFCSYFITFDSGARLELMSRPDIPDNANDAIAAQYKGIIHLAFAVGTMEEVNQKAKELLADGHRVLRGPRTSGDGYYEFETADPENNRLEVITSNTHPDGTE